MDVYAVFRPGADTPFFQAALANLEIGRLAENPILLDKEDDKGNSPSSSSTNLWKTNKTSCIAENSSICQWIGFDRDNFFNDMFQCFTVYMFLIRNIINVFQYDREVFQKLHRLVGDKKFQFCYHLIHY